jgi:hypothetical protein
MGLSRKGKVMGPASANQVSPTGLTYGGVMVEGGWLKETLLEAREDIRRWPDWMKDIGGVEMKRPTKREVVRMVKEWLELPIEEFGLKIQENACPWEEIGRCEEVRYLCLKIFPKLEYFPEGAGSPCPCTFLGVDKVRMGAREFVRKNDDTVAMDE